MPPAHRWITSISTATSLPTLRETRACAKALATLQARSRAISNTSTTFPATNSTIWGNTFTAPTNNPNCVWGAEVQWGAVTVKNNQSNWMGATFALGAIPNAVIENNTMSLLTSGSLEGPCGGRACAFRTNGTHNGTEWIGVNTINGSSVTGCQSPFCAFAPQSYGTKPTVWSPSTPYSPGGPTVPAAPANLRVVSP